jgi:L-threonylcarbamoyladenylate synthase
MRFEMARQRQSPKKMNSKKDMADHGDAQVERAARLLREGRLVAFPTETVYGLGGDATSDRAVASIFAAKNRPEFNPLIIHVADVGEAEKLVDFSPLARLLAKRFWPGPLTLVLERRADCPVSLLASAGLDSLAVRIPAHPLALALLKAVKRPLAAPSANPSGAISPTTAAHVEAGLGGKVAMILDGGPCLVGVESTVLDARGEKAVILRHGGVTQEELEDLLGYSLEKVESPKSGDLRSPGQLESHYAPVLPVRLNAVFAKENEALLGFGGTPEATFDLSPKANLEEAAANLFAMLRALDRPPFKGIAVAAIPHHGLGAAINDRLSRAAANR